MDKQQIAMCGACCGTCKWKEKTGCAGCLACNGNMFWGRCEVAKCCLAKGLPHCGFCQELPCSVLQGFFDNGEHGDNGERLANLRAWAAGQNVFVELGTFSATKADQADMSRFRIRPITREDLHRIVLRCWPEGTVIDKLFETQGTIGMAAWEGDQCVAQLHCYAISLPHWRSDEWPAWNRWWSPAADLQSAVQRDLGLHGDVWAHACCHVGRTLAQAKINDDPDTRYLGRGIGTALCRASVEWAREHGYLAVLAAGAPSGLPEFAAWTGHLPWTRYAKIGFVAAAELIEQHELPGWARGHSPPEIMAEAQAALAAGRPASDLHDRLMVFDLRRKRGGGGFEPE